ncbi:uncharacterized protein LOC126803642 [Argentina anserina]|uniref:uncharacterized protein LOC126803642 n=1 Tax=Argentina anserina TaxID=57926 RepID=UPI0021767BBA|nr:uncharacterized protein LOC126803642 [Potentilla anserina]
MGKISAVSKKILPNPSPTIYSIQRSFHEWSEAKENIKKALDLDDDSGSIEATRRSEESHVRGRAGLRNEERKNWSPPPPGFVKVNVDAAWKKGRVHSGVGAIARNFKGLSMAGASILGRHNSALEAEAEAALKELLFANHLNLSKVIIEGDCAEVFRPILSSSFTANWEIAPTLKRIGSLLSKFDVVLWNWIPREANRVADATAKLAILKACSSEWTNRPPNSLRDILETDGHRPP